MQQVWPSLETPGTTGGAGSREAWVVVLMDPQTGEIDSYGPYAREQAERLRTWCAAELDLDDLSEVVVLVAPMRQ